jgi:hypothetical protein
MRNLTAQSAAADDPTAVAATEDVTDLQTLDHRHPLAGSLLQIAALQVSSIPGDQGDRYRVEAVLANGETALLTGEVSGALETVTARCHGLARTLDVPVIQGWDEETEDQFDAMVLLLAADPDQRQDMIATCEQQIQAGDAEAETYCLLALAWLAAEERAKAGLVLSQGRSRCLELGLADGVMDIDRLGQRYGLVGG